MLLKFILLCLFLLNIFSCGTNCETDEKFLVVKTYAGMGNRLRILASAKIMASLTGRRLVVDWQLLPNEMPGEFSDFFLNPLETYEKSKLNEMGCSLWAIRNEKGGNIKNLNNIKNVNDAKNLDLLENIPEYTENIIYFGTSLNFRPNDKYMSYKEYDEKYTNFYKTLEPINFIQDEVKNFKINNKLEDYYLVGVQYRSWKTGAPDQHSGLVNDPGDKYVPEFIKKMKEYLNKPLSETNNKPVAFYVSSDHKDAKEKISQDPSFNGKLFMRPREANRDTILGQQQDLVDFFLLGNTELIIGTYQSSFSDEAAYLTKEKTKISIGEAAYKSN